MTKDYMQKHCDSGYQVAQTTFAEIAEILEFNAAYTPFTFKDGKRNKANITGAVKWAVLDIDDSSITDEECHLMLDHINHHVVRTSDATNPFKFRILVELDSELDIPDMKWKAFTKILSDELGVTADLLPKSQIFFAYEGRTIHSTSDEAPLSTKLLLDKLRTVQDTKPAISLPKAQKTALLNDPLGTFDYAFSAASGMGSVAIIRACLHAKDLGATKEDVATLAKDINDFWDEPMDDQRLQNTILSQVNRWVF